MSWINKLLGINWKTTLGGLALVVAAVGRIVLAYKTRDFEAIFADTKLIMETVIALIAGLTLTQAKDQNVTGAGPVAVQVAADGSATDREGEDVGTVKTATTGQSAVK